MQNFSEQYIALLAGTIVSVVLTGLLLFHINADAQTLTTFITSLVTLVFMAYALIKRHGAGDITALGQYRVISTAPGVGKGSVGVQRLPL